MSHFTLRDDGIEVRNLFKTRFYPWNDVAGFWLREGKPLGGLGASSPGLLLAQSGDEGRVTVRGGDQHRLKGVKTDEQVRELNRILELGRSGLPVSPEGSERSLELHDTGHFPRPTPALVVLVTVLFGLSVPLIGPGPALLGFVAFVTSAAVVMNLRS